MIPDEHNLDRQTQPIFSRDVQSVAYSGSHKIDQRGRLMVFHFATTLNQECELGADGQKGGFLGGIHIF